MASRKAQPRRRLDSTTAHDLILDATERRLIVAGPAGIRLQEVAAEAGVSHPTILHHFGSRERLVQAVIARCLRTIHSELVTAIAASAGDDKQLEAIFQNVATVLRDKGYGRVILWLSLEGHPIEGEDVHLGDVVDAAHALRLRRTKSPKKPPRDDTARVIVLAALALVGGAVIGPTLMGHAGLPGDQSGARFRKWLVRLLLDHLDKGE